jgi:hypothetical protein
MSHPPNVSHLPTERLAALSDESPTATELAHLTTCADCARERAVYQNLLELASADSARLGAPLTTWERLAPALVADGVIDSGRALPTVARHNRRRGPWLQAAAAVLLVTGGMVAGRVTAGTPVLPLGGATNRLVASADSVPRFGSIEEARAAQAQSQLTFQTATAFLAQQDTANGISETPATIRTRLATLDRLREVVGKALNDAPYDPVINGYYLTTVGQREATLRQLNTALPVGMRLTSY